jgi:hypothetical protein
VWQRSTNGYQCMRAGSWWPALTAGLLAFALYARTLAPGLTWSHNGADGGDFLAAALTCGVPHPSGYPTYQLLLRTAVAVFPGEPTRAGNWLSALCGAVAVAFLADLTRRMLPDHHWRGIVALVAGLAWATSPALWGQAVISEVYTLNALFVLLLLWVIWHWREAVTNRGTGRRWLVTASLVFGLGLGNHLSLALMLPGMAAWLWANRRAPECTSPRTWAAAFLGTALGLSVYSYLPMAALRNPPVNWGDPRTLDRFWWVVSATIYRPLVLGTPWQRIPGYAASWVADALRQLGGGPWGALIAFAGLWQLDRRDHAWWRLTGLVALAYSVYAIGYNTDDRYVYLIPVWAMCALWLAEGLNWGIKQAEGWLLRKPVIGIGRRSRLALLLIALLLLPTVSAARYWSEMDLSGDHEAQSFIENALAEAEPGAVILTASDRPTFSLWYALYGMRRRPDLTSINVSLYAYPWYRQTLATRYPFLAELTGGMELPSLEQLVAEIGHYRPLYRAEPLNLAIPGFREQPGDVLVRMEPTR